MQRHPQRGHLVGSREDSVGRQKRAANEDGEKREEVIGEAVGGEEDGSKERGGDDDGESDDAGEERRGDSMSGEAKQPKLEG